MRPPVVDALPLVTERLSEIGGATGASDDAPGCGGRVGPLLHGTDGKTTLDFSQVSFDRRSTNLFYRVLGGFTADCRPMTVSILPEKAYSKECGERLRMLIDALGIETAQAAADEMGISKQRLNNWLQGNNLPDFYILYRWMRRRLLADANFILWGDWSALPERVAEQLKAELLGPLDPAGGEKSAAQTEPAARGRGEI